MVPRASRARAPEGSGPPISGTLWGDEENGFTTVEWRFRSWKDETTFVTITETGYRGDGDQMVARAIDSMGGFSFVLAAAKALLEHDIVLTLTADHAPEGVQE